jgi:hypothetical protein
MADRTTFSLRAAAGARPLDPETVRRIARAAGAESGEVDEQGVAHFAFGAAGDSATAHGNLQMAARMELGAHWHTRYTLDDAGHR